MRTLATRSLDDGGDPARALKVAMRACDLVPCRDASRLDTLAIAYASTGQFSEAVEAEEIALASLDRHGSPQIKELAETLRARRNLFRARRPYRLPSPSIAR